MCWKKLVKMRVQKSLISLINQLEFAPLGHLNTLYRSIIYIYRVFKCPNATIFD